MVISGGLSTSEKLASANPATRKEGQSELGQQTSTQQKKTVRKARSISSKGFEGTASFQQVFQETKDITKQTSTRDTGQNEFERVVDKISTLPSVVQKPGSTLVGTTPEGFQIKRTEMSQSEFLRTARVRDPFTRRVEETETELTAKQLAEEGGLFATAIKKGTGEKFVLLDGELIPEQQKVKAIKKELIIEPRPAKDTARQPSMIGGHITKVPFTRKVAGGLTELVTRGRLKLPEELKLEIKDKLPMVNIPLKEFLISSQFGIGVFPTEKGIGFGIRDPFKQTTEQQKAFKEIDEQLGESISRIVSFEKVETFSKKKREKALSLAGELILEPDIKTGGKVVLEGVQLAGSELLLSTKERPITTAVQFAGISKALSLSPKLVVAGLGALTTKDVIAAPTPAEKIVAGTTAGATFGGFLLGAAGLRAIKKTIGWETIKIPFRRTITVPETKPLEPFGEPVRFIKLIGKEKSTFKEINKVIGIEEKVAVEFRKDRFTGKPERVEIVERIPKIETQKVPRKKTSKGIVEELDILTTPFETKGLVDVLGLEFGTRSLPIGKRVRVTGEKAKISKVSEIPETTFDVNKLLGVVEPPTTATGRKARQAAFGFTPKEIARGRATSELMRTLGREKGLKDLGVEFTVPGIKDPKAFQKIVERRTKQYKGQFFGTVTTKEQLPKAFQKAILGDIDIQLFKSLRKTEKIGKKITKDLEKAGELVEFKPKELAIFSKTTGEKIIELKPGKGGPGEEMAKAVFGRGLEEKRPVRFGKFYSGKATRGGTQLSRKGAAVQFLRPAITEVTDTPLSFTGAGLFPRGKRFKDLPDFVAQAGGLIKVREMQTPIRATAVGRAVRQQRSIRSEKAYKEFIKSFNKRQQKDLAQAVKESTVGGVKIPIESKLPKKGVSIKSVLPKGVSFKQDNMLSGRVGISPKRGSSRRVPSIKTPSKRVSPSLKSPSIKMLSKISPKSKIPKSLRSPSLKSLSLTSPSLKSPSLYSPSIYSPMIPEKRIFVAGLKFPKGTRKMVSRKSKLFRPTMRQPSLVAVALGKTTRRKRGQDEIFTGLEIRKLLR